MGSIFSREQHSKVSASPFELMCRTERQKATERKYLPGQASEFYFLCRNGKVDEVRRILDADEPGAIDRLNELQPNGSTALHAATYFGHLPIVELLLERDCPRTALNRFGRTAYEEAPTAEMKQLFERADSTDRFHESDAAHAISVYLPQEDDANPVIDESPHFVQLFHSEDEVFEHSLNQQTTAMWLKFYNWFMHTFRPLIEREDFHVDQFDLHKHGDFQQFLRCHLADQEHYQTTMKSVSEAQRRKSIVPLITLYTSERAGFYKPLNQQLARATSDAAQSSHLCDRYLLEFHIHRQQLKQRAFVGTVYRGATVNLPELEIYKLARSSDPPGVIGLKTFTSTSSDPLVALRFATKNPPAAEKKNVLFVLKIPRAVPTIFGIEDISQYGHEREVLILPGNLFVVTDIREDPTFALTTISLRHLHVPVSFLDKIKQTLRAGEKSVL